jgi:hypothetical protein
MAPVSKQGTLSRDYILHARKRGKTRDRAAYYSIICGICFVAVLQTLVHSSVAAAPIPNTQNLFNSSVQTESRRHIHQSVGKIFVAKLTPDVDFLLWIFQRYLPVYDHLDKGCTYFLFGEFGNRWQPVWRYIPKFAIQERSTLPLTGRQRTNVQFDNDTRIFSNSTISDISVVYPSSHLLGFLVVIFPRLTHAHIGHFVRLSRYFYVQVGNVFSPIGLVFGLNSQFVGINRAGSYLQPLQSYEYASEDSHGQPIPSQANRRPFKRGHAFFYFVELLYGYWLACWRGIYWWGYGGWRGIRGNAYVLIGSAFAIHGAIMLLHPVLWQ